jgi:apolipoprotein N-acyltransferase
VKLLAALLAGGCLPLAFAPLHWFLLAPLCYALLLLLWRSAPPAAAFGIGLAFGVGAFGVGTSWSTSACMISARRPLRWRCW